MAKPPHTSLNLWVVSQNYSKSRFDHMYGLLDSQGFQNRFQNKKRRPHVASRAPKRRHEGGASVPDAPRVGTSPGGQGRVAPTRSTRCTRQGGLEARKLTRRHAPHAP